MRLEFRNRCHIRVCSRRILNIVITLRSDLGEFFVLFLLRSVVHILEVVVVVEVTAFGLVGLILRGSLRHVPLLLRPW